MNDTKSWAQGSRFYEQLWVMDGMNYFGSWPKAYRYYEQLSDIIELKDSGS